MMATTAKSKNLDIRGPLKCGESSVVNGFGKGTQHYSGLNVVQTKRDANSPLSVVALSLRSNETEKLRQAENFGTDYSMFSRCEAFGFIYPADWARLA